MCLILQPTVSMEDTSSTDDNASPPLDNRLIETLPITSRITETWKKNSECHP